MSKSIVSTHKVESNIVYSKIRICVYDFEFSFRGNSEKSRKQMSSITFSKKAYRKNEKNLDVSENLFAKT